MLPTYATCIYIRQPAPLGLGHAVLCAKPAVGDAPFFVHLADDLIDAEVPCLKQMAGVHRQHRRSVRGETVPHHRPTSTASSMSVAHAPRSQVRAIVEKPKPSKAPSNLAVVGRYLLTPAIFTHLEKIGHGAGGEIQLTDGIARLMNDEAVYAYRFAGKRFDCGNKLGYLQATVEYALAHPELATTFKAYLKKLSKGF